ncbi:MAG: DUF5677 domain-containing protein [Anaerolineales bacterium]
MPTKSHEAILYRELSIVDVNELIGISSSLLIEQVNYGTNALVRCQTSSKSDIDVDLSIFALYRHLLEITDGIEVLLSNACIVSALPLLRSSFEGYLSMEYILEEDESFERRSLSWLVGYVHSRLDMYKRFDPSTNKGKEARKIFEDDIVTSSFFPLASSLQKQNQLAIENLDSFLSKDHIKPINDEYKKHKNPKWFHLFKGPSTIRDLAVHHKMGGSYEILYRYWSRSAHGQDLLSFISRTVDGESAIGKIRNTKDLALAASLASTFLLGATRKLIKKYRPGEDISRWFKKEIYQYRKSIGAA